MYGQNFKVALFGRPHSELNCTSLDISLKNTIDRFFNAHRLSIEILSQLLIGIPVSEFELEGEPLIVPQDLLPDFEIILLALEEEPTKSTAINFILEQISASATMLGEKDTYFLDLPECIAWFKAKCTNTFSMNLSDIFYRGDLWDNKCKALFMILKYFKINSLDFSYNKIESDVKDLLLEGLNDSYITSLKLDHTNLQSAEITQINQIITDNKRKMIGLSENRGLYNRCYFYLFSQPNARVEHTDKDDYAFRSDTVNHEGLSSGQAKIILQGPRASK